jgi:hypothetical protein
VSVPRTGFWVFVSNPRRSPIDRLMRERLPKDTRGVWTVGENDDFRRDDLGLVRTVLPVGENKRTEAQLMEDGASRQLDSGIYAVCKVLDKPSGWFAAKDDDLWRSGEVEKYSLSKNWRRIPIKFLWWSLTTPLLVADLKKAIPDLRPPSQGQHCFPISEDHFRKIVDRLPGARDAIEGKYCGA